jgi:predicted MPP superfamily phosphohydrolase
MTVNPKNKSSSASAAQNLTRREALRLGAGALLAAGAWPGTLRAEGNGLGGEFTFIAVNDLHYQTEKCGAWFERVVAQMKEFKPALCLVGGDWAEKGTAAELAPPKEIFATLGAPIHGVIGNHDYTTQTDRSAYEKLFPNRLNYHFEHAGWQFVALDTSDGLRYKDTRVQPATFAWIEENLRKLDPKRPTVLFTHFPLGPNTISRPLNADDVLEHFKPFNLRAVYCGHFHGFTERRVGETVLTTNRCCAFSRKNHDFSKEKGFFVCRAKEGRITREFVEVKPA